MLLYIFNPDHDLALANHDVNYMPPAAARQLASDLALLPAWYGGKENVVLASSQYNLSFLNDMKTLFPDLPLLITDTELTEGNYFPVPWGWDNAIYKRLYLSGISRNNLPTAEQIDLIRQRSHRMLAVEFLKQLQITELCCGESFYFTDISEIKRFVENSPACILKAPLSGSGKGLNWCKGIFTPHILHWCENIIRQQGGVVAEPLYDKVLDFAMQFHADSSGQVKFSGYSVFQTKATGAYDGNILNTNKAIEQVICNYIPLEMLQAVRNSLEEKLSVKLQGVYAGYLGVDMMICKFDNSPVYRVHPCVEVNLRMNMGMVARKIYDTLIIPSASGIYKVDYFTSPEEVANYNNRMLKEHPLVMENNKIISGYLPLVPVTPASKYLAWIKVKISFQNI